MIPDLAPARLSTFLSRALLLDLETGPTGAIHKIGAIRGGGETFLRQGRFDERAGSPAAAAAWSSVSRGGTTIWCACAATGGP